MLLGDVTQSELYKDIYKYLSESWQCPTCGAMHEAPINAYMRVFNEEPTPVDWYGVGEDDRVKE